MRKKLLLAFVIFLSLSSFAQNQITIRDIYGGEFRQKYIDGMSSLKDGENYVVINYSQKGATLDKYSYGNLKKIATLVDGSILSNPYFSSYSFSNDESKIILATEPDQIYRHSFYAKHFIYDFKSKKSSELSSYKEQEPSFSPNAQAVAFVRENNIYIKDLNSNKETQITSDGEFNMVINGVCDWVYEEEFGFVKAYSWSPDGKYIAYLKFNESQVPEISLNIFGNGLYPGNMTYKYPKAGEKNSVVTLHIYELKSGATKKVEIPQSNFEYIPRMKWTNSGHSLAYIAMNRLQNDMSINLVDAESLKSKVIYRERDAKYIDINDHLTFLDDNSFIVASEKDGFNHLYHYTSEGVEKNQITKGFWEVSDFYGYDPKEKRIYYQSTENGSINRGIYSIKIDGSSKKSLIDDKSTNSASFSANFKYFINISSSANVPHQYSLYNNNGKMLKMIEDNSQLASKVKKYNMAKKEFFSIKTSDNVELNAWMMKPVNFDPAKKYPVFMYVYGGPGSQTVQNSWESYNYYWYSMLTQLGYIVVSVDNRGTGGKGAAFKKSTYKELGKYEIADQIEAAGYLSSLNYVDKGRIGMFGWSYGGYMTSLAMTKGADVFKMGIAVAPVTNWKFYDSVYTERYMQTPSLNLNGFEQNSPVNFTDKLKGKFLLIHGTGDDNVHVQNTMQMIESLVQANKQFDLFLYPDKDHGIYGGNTRIHLYEMMTDYIVKNL